MTLSIYLLISSWFYILFKLMWCTGKFPSMPWIPKDHIDWGHEIGTVISSLIWPAMIFSWTMLFLFGKLDCFARLYKGKNWYFHLIFRRNSCWVGCHYSTNQKSYCIALVPCLILRVAKTDYIHDGDCK